MSLVAASSWMNILLEAADVHLNDVFLEWGCQKQHVRVLRPFFPICRPDLLHTSRKHVNNNVFYMLCL